MANSKLLVSLRFQYHLINTSVKGDSLSPLTIPLRRAEPARPLLPAARIRITSPNIKNTLLKSAFSRVLILNFLLYASQPSARHPVPLRQRLAKRKVHQFPSARTARSRTYLLPVRRKCQSMPRVRERSSHSMQSSVKSLRDEYRRTIQYLDSVGHTLRYTGSSRSFQR